MTVSSLILDLCVCRLEEVGARWSSSDVEHVSLKDVRVEYADDNDADGNEAAGPDECVDLTDDAATPWPMPGTCQGFYVRDVMERIVRPELETVLTHLPHLWDTFVREGVHFVFSADNSSRPTFNMGSQKIEIGTVKLLLPDMGNQQQAPWLGCIVFCHEGDESYNFAKQILEPMLDKGAFKNSIPFRQRVGNAFSGDEFPLSVVWHLCADKKFVNLVSGLGSNSPFACPSCTWDRRTDSQQRGPRDAEMQRLQREWRVSFLEPLQQADLEKGRAKKADEDARKMSQGAIPSKSTPSQLKSAQDRADETLCTVRARLSGLPEDDPINKLANNAEWHWHRRDLLTKQHFVDVTKSYADIALELSGLLNQIQAQQSRLQDSQAMEMLFPEHSCVEEGVH